MAAEAGSKLVEKADQAAAVLREEAAAVDARGEWPARSVDALRRAGLLALPVPAAEGGAGIGMRGFAAVTERLASACASSAMIYLMHVCGVQTIAASASPRRGEALRGVSGAGQIATLALSERGSRSHFWAPVSRAAKNGGGVVLNCDKSFVTSAGQADWYVVSSGSVGGSAPTESTLYLVEKGKPGFAAGGPWNGFGLRGNASGPMTLRDCKVAEGSRLTEEGKGFDAMMGVILPWFQVGSAAVSIGIAEDALAGAARHTASARFEHLNESLAAALPGVRARLARMRLSIDAARAFLDATLAKMESADPAAMVAVLGCKAVAAESAIEVTDEAMRACGGAAFGRQLSIERNFRDARAASVMAPTTDVLLDFVGKAVAGLPLF